MPADRGWIKQNLRALQSGQARRFRIPLIPANAHANFAKLRLPRFEAGIARCEIKFFVIERVIRNVHLAIDAEHLPVSINDGRGVMIKAGRSFFEKRCDDDNAMRLRDGAKRFGTRPRNGLRQLEIFVIFALAEILRAIELLRANNLRAAFGGFFDQCVLLRGILVRIR